MEVAYGSFYNYLTVACLIGYYLCLRGVVPPTLPPPPIPLNNSQHFMHLNIHIWYEFETCARYSSWQKLTNNDVIVLVTRLEYNLHTRNKMETLWQSRDLHTIYRPDRKWGPDFVSQVLCGLLTTNFDRYVRMTKKLHPWHHRCGHVT